MICRQCWDADALLGFVVCQRCFDSNQRAAGYYGDDEGRAVRRGEDRKAEKEEVSRGTVGGSQGEGQS